MNKTKGEILIGGNVRMFFLPDPTANELYLVISVIDGDAESFAKIPFNDFKAGGVEFLVKLKDKIDELIVAAQS